MPHCRDESNRIRIKDVPFLGSVTPTMPTPNAMMAQDARREPADCQWVNGIALVHDRLPSLPTLAVCGLVAHPKQIHDPVPVLYRAYYAAFSS